MEKQLTKQNLKLLMTHHSLQVETVMWLHVGNLFTWWYMLQEKIQILLWPFFSLKTKSVLDKDFQGRRKGENLPPLTNCSLIFHPFFHNTADYCSTNVFICLPLSASSLVFLMPFLFFNIPLSNLPLPSP